MIIRICIAVQLWLLDVSLPPSTIRYLDASLPDGSPPGWFATWTSRTFGCFDTRTFRYLLGRFATCLKACNLLYSDNRNGVVWHDPSCRYHYKPHWANYVIAKNFYYGFVLYFQLPSRFIVPASLRRCFEDCSTLLHYWKSGNDFDE